MGPQRTLSRELIVEAALRHADAHGLDALSMRRLAGELSVGTMTLYGYFRSREELLDAIIDLGMSQIAPPRREGPGSSSWPPWPGRPRRTLLEHPSLVQARLRRPIVRQEALRSTEAGVNLLTGAGFSPADASQAFRVLFVYVFGSVAFGESSSAPDDRAETHRAIDDLPVAEFPALQGAGTPLAATLSGDEQFAYGLDRIHNWSAAPAALKIHFGDRLPDPS